MIHKNVRFGNIKNVTVVEFGKGTLSVVDGKSSSVSNRGILIKEQEYCPIGEVRGTSNTSDDFQPQVVLLFNNIQSVAVLKEYVDNVYNGFLIDNTEVNTGHGIQLEIEFPD